MARIISIGIQKGGCGKTTTVGLASYILSHKYKVLAVDFDPQGNLTQFLTQKPLEFFEDRTVLEAIKTSNPEPYIYQVSKNLHILPADDYLSYLTKFLYEKYEGMRNMALWNILRKIEKYYHYILIDMPPSLGEHTVNGIVASNYAVAVMQPEMFCYDALKRYIDTLNFIKREVRRDLEFIGILPTMTDARVTLDETIIEKAREEYGDLVFNTIIKRRSKFKEYCVTGITDGTAADREALSTYIDFVGELVERVDKKEKERFKVKA